MLTFIVVVELHKAQIHEQVSVSNEIIKKDRINETCQIMSLVL
jgi:hypothetical protein